MTTYCGYIALLGRPNAGKSTLLNALVGQKLAGVSMKPQTTRQAILGISTSGAHQFLFIDTPGIHKSRHFAKEQRALVNEAYHSLESAHVLLYLVAPDSPQGLHSEDIQTLATLQKMRRPDQTLLLYLSQEDRLKKQSFQAVLATIKNQVAELGWPLAVGSLSAKRPESLAQLRQILASYLPEGPFQFPEDEITDQPTSLVVAELIREAIFRTTGDELPYQANVDIKEFVPASDNRCLRIQAEILVGKEVHKGMLIGKDGNKIKLLGITARKSIEELLGEQVFLQLNCRVQPKWTDNRDVFDQL